MKGEERVNANEEKERERARGVQERGLVRRGRAVRGEIEEGHCSAQGERASPSSRKTHPGGRVLEGEHLRTQETDARCVCAAEATLSEPSPLRF